MEEYLDGVPFCKRLFYKAASKGLYPTMLSVIGFAYIAIPSNLQITIRHWLPLAVRDHLLMLFTSEGWLIALLIFTVFFAIWGGIGSHATVYLVKKKYEQVSEKNEQLRHECNSKSINCYKLFSNYLYSYYEKFDFTVNERISLYKLDMHLFSCIGRYSDNEVFNAKPSLLYPNGEGCIFKAWQIGKIQDAGAPDSESNMADWISYHVEKFNFSEDVLKNIKMKSRSFYGFRLRNTQQKTIAVIIFESLNPNGIAFGKLDKFFNDCEKKNITRLIESLENHIPSLEMAKKEGF